MIPMTSTLQSAAVVVFDVADPTVDDVEAFRVGDWFQRTVGGSGMVRVEMPPVGVAVTIPTPAAGQL
jgi:hypothetical protein